MIEMLLVIETVTLKTSELTVMKMGNMSKDENHTRHQILTHMLLISG